MVERSLQYRATVLLNLLQDLVRSCASNKDEQRGVYQPYNLTILALVLGAYAIKGLLTNETLFLAATALPGTFLGTWLGKKAYRRLGDLAFRRVVLFLLLVSGLGLVLSALA